MWIAAKGLAGQTFSHAPQPIHLFSFTVGILSQLSLSGSFLTILMALAGQCLEQLPQCTPSVFTIQLSRLMTAIPIWIDDFSTLFTGLIAPAGHT